jgi:hypothetical protein
MAKKKIKEEVYTSSQVPMEVVKVTEPSKYSFWAILVAVILVALAGVFLWRWLFQAPQAGAVVENPCEQFCANWNHSHTVCEDWDYRLCHVNPSHAQNLSFNNLSSCENHLGTPHNNSTYDLRGLCPIPSPTPTATPNPTPTLTPSPTPPVCDQESYSCSECEEKPNDDWCGEYKFDYCKENYKCEYADDVWGCQCPIEPTPTPTPEVTPVPTNPPENKPEGCTHDCGIPACTDQIPEAVVNPHVYRNGESAIVKWYPKEGNKVNIYYRLNASSGWQYSVQVDNTGYFEIKGLDPQAGYTFGLQSVNGCSADGIVNASIISEVIDGGTNRWILFR